MSRGTPAYNAAHSAAVQAQAALTSNYDAAKALNITQSAQLQSQLRRGNIDSDDVRTFKGV